MHLQESGDRIPFSIPGRPGRRADPGIRVDNEHVINAHVILSVEKLSQKAEATLHINGANVFADSVHEDMYAAIDGLIDKLDRQVLKHKEKKINHRGNGHKVIETD